MDLVLDSVETGIKAGLVETTAFYILDTFPLAATALIV